MLESYAGNRQRKGKRTIASIRRGEQKHMKKFKNDDWNELDIIVTGTEAVCHANGEPLAKMKVPVQGGIGLQAETGTFESR
jgi:hypothetical protein